MTICTKVITGIVGVAASGIAVVMIGSLLSNTTLAQDMESATGNAEDGALLYYQHGCYGCHGFNGYGRHDLVNADSPYLLNEQVFTAYLRARQYEDPLFPSTNMPNYPENAIDNEGTRDIYAFIRSLPENQPATEDISAMQAILEAADDAASR